MGCEEARCVYKFSSPTHFTEGTFDRAEDLCNPNISVDTGCADGQCERLRRGLCALPPFKQPRTLVRTGGLFCLNGFNAYIRQ